MHCVVSREVYRDGGAGPFALLAAVLVCALAVIVAAALLLACAAFVMLGAIGFEVASARAARRESETEPEFEW